MKLLTLQSLISTESGINNDSNSTNNDLAIYCMDSNANCNLLAVGYIDGCIKIFDLNRHLLISNLDSHSGTVTCLKWTNCGNFLVSGSDDKTIIIWKKVVVKKSLHFSLVKRLIGHESDIQNISLNSADTLMMSCGLDCKIIIWQFTKQTQSFNKVIELDNIHKNFIKSCEFDPTGKFFASISDDKTLKIYKYSFNTINNSFKFNLEAEISEPFKNSKNFKITYFNKMHWSPNGQFLIIPNGTSGQLENCCIIIDRLNHWDYSFKLIGNAFPIEVCKFNPSVFINENEYKADFSISDITEQNLLVATGGQEKCLVLWSTTKSVPLIVIKNLFKKQISDLAWNRNGTSLYISSFDGDIKILSFENTNELENFMNVTNDDGNILVKAVDPKYNYKFLQKYGALGSKADNDDFGNENDNWKNMESIDEVEIYKQIPKILPNKFILDKNDNQLTSLDNNEIKGQENNKFDEKGKHHQPTVNILVPKKRSIEKNEDGTIKKRRLVLQPVETKKIDSLPEAKVPAKQVNKPQELNESDLFELKTLSKSSLKLPRLGYQTLVQGLKESEFQSEQRQVLFNDSRSMDELTSKLSLNKMTMSSVIPDTDLHVQIFKNMNMSFEIRNNKERKMIYDPYNTGSLLDTDLSNLTKMECYLNGKLMWDYFCNENITHLANINKDKLLMILDDHQAIILSSKSGMPLTNKIYFNEPIVQAKSFGYDENSEEYHVLLIGINGTLSVLNERQALAKEVSITNLLYDPLPGNTNLSSKKIKCLKKIYSVKFDKDKHQIQLTLLNYKSLYHSELEKYLSCLSKNPRSNKSFKLNENSIIKELRRIKYKIDNSSLLTTEEYVYCFRMGCWKIDS
ncbi:uncharacterized protein HGUI_00902 [Hanseniaspora guilliermondii]|uniref:Protein HIR n=1 Tax=Hanseniaspora guilliermondii TaxID=56406 RepID=A0A1L0FGI8_9ASCO|nr:uncharacterized protein HGUI_00902 [Hanseniaspora guilliermondii]